MGKRRMEISRECYFLVKYWHKDIVKMFFKTNRNTILIWF